MKTVDGALAFAEGVYSRVSDAGIIAAEVRRLREENERQRFDILAMNQSLDLLREENERLRAVERAAQWYIDNPNSQRMAISQIKAAIDAARGGT